jgi:hypothetical protein
MSWNAATRVLLAFFVTLQLWPVSSFAWIHGVVVAPTGGAQVGVSSSDLFGGVLNAIDSGNQYSFASGALPSQLDANGLPNTTLTAGQNVNFAIGFVSTQTQASTQWVFKWTPQGSGTLPFFMNAQVSNVTATGCTESGSGNTTISMTGGQACRVTFNFTSPPGNNVSIQFQAGSWGAQTTKPIICRVSDEAAITAGGYFTPEYISEWSGLNLHTIRTMSWINTGSLANTNQSLWKYRSTPSSLGWGNARFPPTVWGGTGTGTDQYTVSLPTDSGASGWVDGEVIQANISNSSTASAITISGAVAADGTHCNSVTAGLVCLTVSASGTLSTNQLVYISNVLGTWEANGVQTITVVDGTHIALQGVTFANAYTSGGGLNVQTLTVTGKTGGTVPIANEYGSAFGTAFTPSTLTSGIGTFVYDALLGVVKWKSGGIVANVPIEVQVALANALSIDLWTVIPTWDNSYNYATSEAALIASILHYPLRWHVEYSNEVWNTGFPQTAYVNTEGLLLGGISTHGVYSLRVRQMMAAVAAAWAPRSSSTLVRVIAWQAFGDSSTTTNRLNSSELNSASNAKLLAYAGSVNYTTQGQRAVDFADAGAYATYFSGALFTNGFNNPYQSDASAVTQIQTLATAFNSNANDPTSLATVDNDFRQGTILNNTISSVSGTTINATANGLSNGQRGVFTNTGGALYTGVSLNTPYYVVSAATNSFSVSATNGGAAISLSGGSGTSSFGVLAGQTMLDLSQIIYQNSGGNTSTHPGWETVAATYDSYRTGVSQAKLWIDNYEGALEAIAPTTAQCTTMGVTVGGSAATAATALANGLVAYKNSTPATTLALAQINQMMGRDSTQPITFGLMAHSRTPSWFQNIGPSQWALLSGNLGSSAYATYNGVASFH